jgi:hypothetical protein
MDRPKVIRRALFVATVAAIAAAVVAQTASAHNGNAQISCTAVTFNYVNQFGSGTHNVQETVFVDGAEVAQQNFSFNGDGGASNTVAITVPSGSHTVSADAVSTNQPFQGQTVVGFPLSAQVSCSVPDCPTGTKLNFRWHYSANGSSGSWSGTQTYTCPSVVTLGPQSMEGDLRVSPGQPILVGYDFSDPGNQSSFFVTVAYPQVTFNVDCVSGAKPSQPTFTVYMPTLAYHVTNDQWYPSGDQHSPLVWQGAATVPDLCGGGQLRLDKGGTFTSY